MDGPKDSKTLVFLDDEFCPCASGKTVAACRCKSRNFVPPAVDVHPHGVITGIRVKKCYANPTFNCLPPLSADHAIANAINRDFAGTPIIRTLSDGSTRTVAPSAAGRKVLCQRHNSALSPLDQVGRRFVGAMRSQIKHQIDNVPEDTHVLFNGFDVERWMLKVLCTVAYNKPVSRVYASRPWRVPKSWLGTLFSGDPLPNGAGVYTPRVARGRFAEGIMTAAIVGGPPGTLPAIGSALLDARDGARLLGISFCIYGLDLDLFMERPRERSQYWYRPRMWRMRNGAGGIAHIHIGWDEYPPSFSAEACHVDRENVRDGFLR